MVWTLLFYWKQEESRLRKWLKKCDFSPSRRRWLVFRRSGSSFLAVFPRKMIGENRSFFQSNCFWLQVGLFHYTFLQCVKTGNFVFKKRNYVLKIEELCIKNEEVCIKNEGFVSKMMNFAALQTSAGRSVAVRWWFSLEIMMIFF